MSKSLTEVIGEQATDALHEAIRVAWQAGYDQALLDNEQHFITTSKENNEE